MAAPVLGYSRLVALANVLLDTAASSPDGIALGVTEGTLLEISEALCRCASLVAEVKIVARDAIDVAPVDTRRRLQETVRDFEIGEVYASTPVNAEREVRT